MSQFYEVDSTRVSHREYWWGAKSPLVLIGWLLKWLRVRIPSSSDDPNVDSTLPFVVESLPPDIAAAFQVATDELAAAGFHSPIYQVIHDPGTRTTVYWATFLHASDRCFARIHQRIWQRAQAANRGLFVVFFTEFADRTFFVSSSGKPDMAAPASVQMNRMHGAKTPALWAAHQRLAEESASRKMVSPVNTREELLAASERHHELVRDFHLARGVFRPRTEKENALAEAFAVSVARAQAGGSAHAEVLAEIEKLQERKTGWGTTAWVLLGSLVLFLAAGAAQWDWKFTLWIIPVLFFHEAGHWLAMRVFRYRNLRMFFIPFFGAAVTGQNFNVPGWKKVLVSLAGPVPGIVLGAVLGATGLILKRSWMNEPALILILVNGFNLLPLLPLDGGHVLHATLFCRNRWLDITFRVLAIIGLLALSITGVGRFFMYLGIALAVGLPVMFKLAKVTDELRRTPLPPPLADQDHLPTPTAEAIITALKAAFPKGVNAKMLASHTLNVYETLNARPPGVLATLGLLGVHAGALLLATVFAILLLIGKHVGLGDFMQAASRQPRHAVECGSVRSWRGQGLGTNDPAPRNLLVATCEHEDQAARAFAALTNRVPPEAALGLFGQSLLLSLPASDDAARERWFDELQSQSTNLFVSLSNNPVPVTFTFIAPTEQVASNLTQELKDCTGVVPGLNLIAPWSPAACASSFDSCRRARQAWSRIDDALTEVWGDPSLKESGKKMAAAQRRGAAAETKRLLQEQERTRKELERKVYVSLQTDLANPVDPVLLDLHKELAGLNYTNRAGRAAVLGKVAAHLGGDVAQDHPTAPIGGRAWGVMSGWVQQHGLLIEVRWMSFNDPLVGLPAFAEWLCNAHCQKLQYEFGSGVSLGGFDEDDESSE